LLIIHESLYFKEMSVIEDEILLRFLERSSKAALEEVKQEGTLSEKNALPLLLKAQFNHITHLDMEMVTKAEFEPFRVRVAENMVTKIELTALSDRVRLIEDEMLTKAEFQKFVAVVEYRFEAIEKRFDELYKFMRLGFGFTALAITLSKIL